MSANAMRRTTEMRNTESFRALLRESHLRSITDRDDGGYDVASESGNTYRVWRVTLHDEGGSMYFTWQCSCPARKKCRHIDAVKRVDYAEALAAAQCGDEDGIEIVERTDPFKA